MIQFQPQPRGMLLHNIKKYYWTSSLHLQNLGLDIIVIQTLPASEEEALHCSLTAHLHLKFQGEWSLDPLWQVYESCSTESHELSGGLLALNIYGEFWPEEWYSWYTEFCLALLFTVIYLKHFFLSPSISLSKFLSLDT